MKRIFVVTLAVSMLAVGCTSQDSNASNSEQTHTQMPMETSNLSPEERMKNMQEVLDYVRECGYYALATVEGDQPRVRAFNSFEIINGKLYIMTGKSKDVYQQLAKNGKFELIALKPDRSAWLRVSGTLVDDPDVKAQEEYLKRNPQFNSSYQAGDGNMAMLYLSNVTARYCSFSGNSERRTNF